MRILCVLALTVFLPHSLSAQSSCDEQLGPTLPVTSGALPVGEASLTNIADRVAAAVGSEWMTTVDDSDQSLVITSRRPVAVLVQNDVSHDPPGSERQQPLLVAQEIRQPIEIRFQTVPFFSPQEIAGLMIRRAESERERLEFHDKHLTEIVRYGKLSDLLPCPPSMYHPETEREKDLIAEYELLWNRTDSRGVPRLSHFHGTTAFAYVPLDGAIVGVESQLEFGRMLANVERTLQLYAVVAGLEELKAGLQKELPKGWEAIIDIQSTESALVIRSAEAVPIFADSPNIGPRTTTEHISIRLSASSYVSPEIMAQLKHRNVAMTAQRHQFAEQHLTEISAGEVLTGGLRKYSDNDRPNEISPEQFFAETQREKDLIAEYRLLWKRTVPETLPTHFCAKLNYPLSFFRHDSQPWTFVNLKERRAEDVHDVANATAKGYGSQWWGIEHPQKSAEYQFIRNLVEGLIKQY